MICWQTILHDSALGGFAVVQDCTHRACVVLGPLCSPSLGCARQFQLWALAVWESLSTMKVLSNFHNLFQLSTSPCRCSGVGLYGYSGCDKYTKGFSSFPSVLNAQLSAFRKAVFRLHWKQESIQLADARVVYFSF